MHDTVLSIHRKTSAVPSIHRFPRAVMPFALTSMLGGSRADDRLGGKCTSRGRKRSLLTNSTRMMTKDQLLAYSIYNCHANTAIREFLFTFRHTPEEMMSGVVHITLCRSRK